jgi:hypothetical protein
MIKMLFLVLIIFFVSFSGCSGNTINNEQFVLIGNIKTVSGKMTFAEKWYQATNADQSHAEEGTEIEVNIVNCSGYLASAKMVHIWQAKWQAAIISDTIADDVTEKIKLCRESSTIDSDAGTAFAIIKPFGKTKNFKLANPDLRKALSSLPTKVQDWAICAESLVPENCVRKEKNILSLTVGDNWADTNGDGEIDFIEISGNCSNSGDYICGKKLKWNGFWWVEISSSQPA